MSRVTVLRRRVVETYTGDRQFSKRQRRRLAKTGAAMPGGGFPIENEQDLHNAIRAIGRAKNPAAARAHIRTRARSLGLTKLLPDDWSDAAPRSTHGVLSFHDTVTLVDGLRRTTDGYLTGYARVARAGVQMYKGHELRRPDLDDVAVYRPPEEVFHVDAMHSVAHRPITMDHPPEMVDSANWKKYGSGHLGDEVVRDGDHIKVPLVIMDKAAIDAYEQHGVKQLSLGYSADIQWGDGVTPTGERYNAVQRGIRVNHLAIVPEARGGPDLRLGDRVRAADDDMTYDDDTKECPDCGEDMPEDADTCPSCGYHQDAVVDGATRGVRNMSNVTMTTLVVDGINVDIEDRSAQIVARYIAKLQDKLSDAKAAKKADEEEAAEEKKRQQTDSANKQKQIDALTGENAALKKQVADATLTPERLDALVKDRAMVIDAAVVLLGDKFVFDGKKVEDIRRAAVVAALGDEAARAMNDGAVEGAFRALTTQPRGGTRALGDAIGRAHRPGFRVDTRDAAMAEREKNLTEAWRTPAKAS